MSSPIPEPKPTDHEDVSWALSTAQANWKRGDHADALRWVQRAAESASEAGLDARYLELAKAAADLVGFIESSPRITSAPAHDARASATMIQPMPVILPDRKSNAPLPARSSAPPPNRPSGVPVAPRIGTSAPPAARASTAPQRPSAAPQKPAATAPQKSAAPPRATGQAPPRKETKPPKKDKAPQSKRPGALPKPSLAGLTRPLDPEDMTQISPPSAPPVTEAQPLGHVSVVEEAELEPWPTQTSADPAVAQAVAFATTNRRSPLVDNDQTLIPNANEVRPMQALRAVLTRAPDGTVHVSLATNRMVPNSVEVLVVSLDTATELATWLK